MEKGKQLQNDMLLLQKQDQKSIDAIKAIGQINNLNTGKM